MLAFQIEKLGDVREEAEPLLRRHWEEIAVERDTVPLDPDWDTYARVDAAGMRLLRVAEEHLRARGVNRIVSKVKLHFDTGPLFERLGYRAIERIYIKSVG